MTPTQPQRRSADPRPLCQRGCGVAYSREATIVAAIVEAISGDGDILGHLNKRTTMRFSCISSMDMNIDADMVNPIFQECVC